MKNTKFILFTIFLILISASFVSATYDRVGTTNGNYDLEGTGFFNTALDIGDLDIATRAISSPTQGPLIEDLDGDGTNEIIVLDGKSIRLFQDHTLTIVDAYTLTTVGTALQLSNMVIQDIDSDGYKEIIIFDSQNETVKQIQYNGSLMTMERSFSCGDNITGHVNEEGMITCRNDNRCFGVLTTNNGGTNRRTWGFSFGQACTERTVELMPSKTHTFQCVPLTKSIAISDYNIDGEDEFIVNMLEVGSSGNEKVVTYAVSMNSSYHMTKELTIEKDVGNLVSQSVNPARCDGTNIPAAYEPVAKYFTPPVVFNFDGSASNGEEIIYGSMKDQDEFKIYSFLSDGSALDDYPEIYDADGVIVSNAFRTDAFPGTDNNDVCVVGFADDEGEIDILCVSELGTEILESYEFQYDISNLWNVSKSLGNYNIMSHSTQQSTETTEGDNLDEVLNTYGVFAFDWSSCNNLLGTCDADHIFEINKQNATILSDDVEGIGRDDLLLLTDTNLWYYDDGFTNSPGEIDEYTINPCLDSTWKENTTVGITIKVTDPNSDIVNARAILYYGDANEQDSNWSINGSSGTSFSFSFTANKTISTATLRLMGRDWENQADEDIIDLTFSVNTDGVEFGDCTTTVDVETTAEAEADAVNVTVQNDTIDNFISNTKEELGVTMSDKLLWLLIIAVVTGSILWGASKEGWEPRMALTGVGIFNAIMVVLGVAQGIFSAVLIFIIIIMVIGILVAIYRKAIFGGG